MWNRLFENKIGDYEINLTKRHPLRVRKLEREKIFLKIEKEICIKK